MGVTDSSIRGGAGLKSAQHVAENIRTVQPIQYFCDGRSDAADDCGQVAGHVVDKRHEPHERHAPTLRRGEVGEGVRDRVDEVSDERGGATQNVHAFGNGGYTGSMQQNVEGCERQASAALCEILP